MKIERIKIKNYKALKDVDIRDLPEVCVVVGRNGVGKTTFFDVFGFLGDALKENVATALNKRGGFSQVISRDSAEQRISFEIKFRVQKGEPLVTYELKIGEDEEGNPQVEKELLKYRRGKRGKPFEFLNFKKGAGSAIKNEESYTGKDFKEEREQQELDNKQTLAIKGLGQFKRYKAVSAFRELLEKWFVAKFQIEHARAVSDTGISEHLNTTASNLAQVAKYMRDHHKEIFKDVLEKMRKSVPGVEHVEAVETVDGRILLRFKEEAFKEPFMARYVSDGTLKMFAYLVLLHDPKPFPLLCIEEPENYLYHGLFPFLVDEMRDYAQKGEQVFVSTHSPLLLDDLKIEEAFIIRKEKGYSKITPAKENDRLKNFMESGDKLGRLWEEGGFKDMI